MTENTNNRRYYVARAKEWQLAEPESGSNFYLAVRFDVLTESSPEKSLTWRGFFTEKSMERTIEAIRTMGYEGDDLSALEGLDRNEVELVVEDEEFEGKKYARVVFVNKPRALQVKQPLSPEKAKVFAASMKAAFRAHDAANGKRTTAPPKPNGSQRPEPPPLSDADIPF